MFEFDGLKAALKGPKPIIELNFPIYKAPLAFGEVNARKSN